MQNNQTTRGKAGRTLAIILLVLGMAGIGYYLYTVFFPPTPPLPPPPASAASASSLAPTPAPSSSEESSSTIEDPTIHYPAGKLFITQERADYDGSMTLTVPRLGIDQMPVYGDVSTQTLDQGIGLYDYAQMPGIGNRNVSIAGHRDIRGCEFYYVDTIVAGDLLTLHYQGKDYIYRYRDNYIVEESDWAPIYTQGFSCLSLTSCTPIGVASHRIIVRAELIEIVDQASGVRETIPPAVVASSQASSLQASSAAASVPAT